MDKDLIEQVEKQRLELEANITRLRSAVNHWQTLELDYEGLKGEFQRLEEDTSKDDCLNAARDFQPHKVDEKELIELIEPTKGKVRRPSQIRDVLSKRVEYVSKNIASLRGQITRLEKERNALLLAEPSEHQEDAGLPAAEILEELDEDGNVISSTVQPHGDSASKVLDVLETAKVPTEDRADVSDPTAPESETTKTKTAPGLKHKVSVADQGDTDDDSVASEIISQGASKAASHHPTRSEDTEEEARLRQEMLQYGLGEVGNIVAELDMIDGEDKDFDEEDVDLEDISDFDNDDYDDSFDEDESEDEDGRVKGSFHSEKYRKHMEELQNQLGFKLENVGPSPDLPAEVQAQIEHLPPSEVQRYIETLPPVLRKQIARPPAKEAARKAAIARAEAMKSSLKEKPTGLETDTTKQKKKSKKKVAFASELDIAPEPTRTATAPPNPKPATTSETIVERSSSSSSLTSKPSAPPPQPAKPSRFKAARSAQPQTPLFPPPMAFPDSPKRHTTPEGPPGRTISHTLVERPSTNTTSAPPDDSAGDFDSELQKRQIALEHHALRNKLIHEQGGYVQGGELENWGDEYAAPEMEDPRTGKVKKISRFKAARMRG